MAANLRFRSIERPLRTIAGYEAMNVIRKGQIRWHEALGNVQHIEQVDADI
jgi:hypothetical protein